MSGAGLPFEGPRHPRNPRQSWFAATAHPGCGQGTLLAETRQLRRSFQRGPSTQAQPAHRKRPLFRGARFTRLLVRALLPLFGAQLHLGSTALAQHTGARTTSSSTRCGSISIAAAFSVAGYSTKPARRTNGNARRGSPDSAARHSARFAFRPRSNYDTSIAFTSGSNRLHHRHLTDAGDRPENPLHR